MKRSLFLLMIAFAFLIALVACESSTATVKPKNPIIPEDKMPEQILDPSIFPLFSDLYKGGLKIDTDSKVYIWNGCRILTMTNEDYYEPTDYWKITINPGVDWFGWGIHHYPSGTRDMSGFEQGYLHFALKSTPKSGPIKIGIKSGYVNESWIAITNGAYGFQYDEEWYVLDIPFKNFLPHIQFSSINAFLMFSQKIVPAVTGSVYYMDQVLWVKDTNAQVKNVDIPTNSQSIE